MKSWEKNKTLLYTLEGTILSLTSSKFVRMFISVKSRPDLKMGHIWSKAKSLGQILENHVYILEGTVLIHLITKEIWYLVWCFILQSLCDMEVQCI